jgi:signal recognition particle subunit SRP19
MKRMVLWPSYFDSRLSEKQGRRAPKNLAVSTPNVDEVAEAANNLGLEAEVDKSKAFPSTPWIKGRVSVLKKFSKQETIRKVGTILKEGRSDQS